MSVHEEFADAIAAYALGALGAPGEKHALDAAEARVLEAHLATCAECRAELADLRRAVNGIGLSTVAEEPPAHLRAKVVNRAELSRGTRSARGSSSVVPWILAAASLALVVASAFYAMMARQQASEALAGKTAADARVNALQSQVTALDARLSIINAPDVVRVELAGQPDAPGATAHVFMSAKRGMVLVADNLPTLAAGKTYQLWVVTKQAPVSIGIFTVAADGSITGTMPISAEASLNPVAVAVTIEPAGGVPSPTGPKVLVGLLAPQP